MIAVSVFGTSSPSTEVAATSLTGVPLPHLEDRAELTAVIAENSRAISVTWTVPRVRDITGLVCTW